MKIISKVIPRRRPAAHDELIRSARLRKAAQEEIHKLNSIGAVLKRAES